MNAPIDLAAVKGRQQMAWASGDYAVIGTTLQIVGESLGRSMRLALGRRRSRRGGRQRQCHARRGAPRRPRNLDRLRVDASRSRRDAGARRRARREVPGRGRRGAAVSRRELRRRAVHVRRDVRTRSRDGRFRDGARVPSRRTHRSRQLDARRLHRPAVQDARSPRAAARGRAAAVALGRGSASRNRCSATKAASIVATPKMFNFRYRSAAHFIDVFRRGTARCTRPSPRCRADKAAALERDLTELLNGMNRGGPRSLVVPSEYLEDRRHPPLNAWKRGCSDGSSATAGTWRRPRTNRCGARSSRRRSTSCCAARRSLPASGCSTSRAAPG